MCVYAQLLLGWMQSVLSSPTLDVFSTVKARFSFDYLTPSPVKAGFSF